MKIPTISIPVSLTLPSRDTWLPFRVDSGKTLWYHGVSLGAPVAQVDRASDFESAGRRFESCRAYQWRILAGR